MARIARIVTILAMTVTVLVPAPDAAAGEVVRISRAEELESLLSKPLDDVEIHLSPGEYHLNPKNGVDSTCGNCEDPHTFVPMTYGIEIRGHRVSIVGPRNRSAVIHTHAGYGLYFNGCRDCAVERLSVTDGVRDPDARATDAAVVVKRGTVRIADSKIFDNIGDPTVVAAQVVGIIGVCGREGGELFIEDNDIIRNSWDGIALYRDALGVIEGNTIDGVDKARGEEIGGGRGVGIGVTWNATADIHGNLVRRYWKGIGIFVDAWGCVQRNIVEDIVTWGIAYWDADKGTPVGIFEENVIYKTGACGASITCAATPDPRLESRFVRNVISKTGQDSKYDAPDSYCLQTALALQAVPEGFDILDNVFFDNRRATEDLPDYDVGRDEFLVSIARMCKGLRRSGIFERSDFVRDFCAQTRSR